jgi:hypothetical protein
MVYVPAVITTGHISHKIQKPYSFSELAQHIHYTLSLKFFLYVIIL